MKKIISALLIILMMAPPVFASEEEFTIEDAYAKCCDFFPEFVENIKASGVSDEQIITFLKDIQTLLLTESGEITEENFDEHFYSATNTAIGYRRNIAVRNAISAANPDASVQFEQEGVISEEFQPLYITIKNLIFVHRLIGTDEVRAAVCFLSDAAAGFFVSAGARAVIAVYDAEGMLCEVKSCEIEEDSKIEFDAAEGGKVKLMVLGDSLEPFCVSAEKKF